MKHRQPHGLGVPSPARPSTRDIKEVWVEYKKKKTEPLRNILMEHYLHLVRYNAERIHVKLPDEVELDDLMSAGIFGLMDAIAALVEAEVSRFPPEVGHVLGSRRLRTHDSLAGRLTYLAWKGRDVMHDGAAVFKKLISHG